MNILTTNQPSEFTPQTLAGLEECSEESVYAPGYIQPHGLLLVLQLPHLTILQISENIERFWGIPATAVLGKSLQRLFSRAQVTQISQFLQQGNLAQNNPFTLRAKGHIFRGTLHQTEQALILELEPHLLGEKTHSIQFYQRLQSIILNLQSATGLMDLTQTLARQIKALTEFDRVMIYRFEADDHGVVIAEAKENSLESYLGLHFPAIDIPVPARKLFLHNWVRQIPDVNYHPAHLITVASPSTPPLDLSACVLRGVSPYHIEYLQNMGVAGSLTISLIDDHHHLWGLIACHHYSPKLVDYEIRKTCELLGQFASMELIRQQEHELDQYRHQIQTIQEQLQQAFLQESNFIQQALTRHAPELLQLVHAQGVAIVLDQEIVLVGQTPSYRDIQALLGWLPQLNQPEIYLTNCLARIYAPASAWTPVASGILLISLVLQQKSYHLIWFRPEQIQTVDWAGNPQGAVIQDELGALHLCPRKSFELWKETVRDMSLPWQVAEIEAAQMMRSTLMLALLEFSQAALEQAAERAAIANRAKSQFLAKMSHELRTPLNAILGFTQVMHHSPQVPAEFQQYLNIISRSGEHLLHLINDVLEMSRIEAGQLSLTEHPFNLQQLLQSIKELFELKAAQKGLILSFQTTPNVPHYVCGDEAKVRQILINLLGNAIKFTDQGRVDVQIGVTDGFTGGNPCSCYPSTFPVCNALQLYFIVKDTGCGVAYQDWETIFEAFMQTEPGRQAEGTGLGLCISRQYARLMGGDITVQSVVNQGSSFTFQARLYQPIALGELETATEQWVIELEPGQPIYRILVADDVVENCYLTATLLETVGFEVRTVTNGTDAIAQWQSWQPDLILMDIEMPQMDGFETTRRIRSAEQNQTCRDDRSLTHPQSSEQLMASSTKIIALTAYAFDSDRTASLQAGCDDYLAKPFTPTGLYEVIARHLGVLYRYQEAGATPPAIPIRQTLTPQDLAIMPVSWRTQVYAAALSLKEEDLHQLINQIPLDNQTLITGLIWLVENFDFDIIATLAQGEESL